MGVRFSPVPISREQVPVLQAAKGSNSCSFSPAMSRSSNNSFVPSPESLCPRLGVWKAKGTHTVQQEEISHPAAASASLPHSTLPSRRTRLGKLEKNKAQ